MNEVEYLLSLKHRVDKESSKLIQEFEKAENVENLKKVGRKIGINFDIKNFEDAKKFLAYHIIEWIYTK